MKLLALPLPLALMQGATPSPHQRGSKKAWIGI